MKEPLFTTQYYEDLVDIQRTIPDVIEIIKADLEEDMLQKIKRILEEEIGRELSIDKIKRVIYEKNITLEDI